MRKREHLISSKSRGEFLKIGKPLKTYLMINGVPIDVITTAIV